MPLFLSTRDTLSQERMDDPHCEPDDLINTYRQFSTINSMISGWKSIYKNRIRPLLTDGTPNTLLDIGFGGGDIPIKLAKWATKDGLNLDITAIETDARALKFVQSIETPTNVQFKHMSSSKLLKDGKKFDFVISNHLLHHLDQQELHQLLHESKLLSKKCVLFNDIERSDLGYLLFNIFSRPVFRSSFITRDGLTSIRRSYTFRELEKEVSESWDVQRLFPFRLLLQYKHSS